jgi:hypothetical protein
MRPGFDDFSANVSAEIDNQLQRWGSQMHEPDFWLGIIAEEFGEVAKAVIERNRDAGIEELTHLAACAYQLWYALANEQPYEWERVKGW